MTPCISLPRFAAFSMLVLCACATSQTQLRTTAVERAAFDLECPAEQLKVTQLGDTITIGRTTATPGLERTVFGVSGCGTKGVYVVECVAGLGDSQCNAVLNADVEPRAKASAPGTPTEQEPSTESEEAPR